MDKLEEAEKAKDTGDVAEVVFTGRLRVTVTDDWPVTAGELRIKVKAKEETARRRDNRFRGFIGAGK